MRALPLVGELAEGPLDLAGIIGIAAGGVSVALYVVEKQAKARVEEQLSATQAQVKEREQQLEAVRLELLQEQKARKEAESYKGRLDATGKEMLKLERALEIKDGQLATFMTTAHKQIQLLEGRVRELQKLP